MSRLANMQPRATVWSETGTKNWPRQTVHEDKWAAAAKWAYKISAPNKANVEGRCFF